jgi:hypothetical protein
MVIERTTWRQVRFTNEKKRRANARANVLATALHDWKAPVTAAELLNGLEQHRDSAEQGPHRDCGAPERHEYELYVARAEHHTGTKTRYPRPTDRERFHKTMLNEFYRVAFRKSGRWTNCRSTCTTGCRSTTSGGPHHAGATENAVADVRRQCAFGEGGNASGVNLVKTLCLSDEVLSP